MAHLLCRDNFSRISCTVLESNKNGSHMAISLFTVSSFDLSTCGYSGMIHTALLSGGQSYIQTVSTACCSVLVNCDGFMLRLPALVRTR